MIDTIIALLEAYFAAPEDWSRLYVIADAYEDVGRSEEANWLRGCSVEEYEVKHYNRRANGVEIIVGTSWAAKFDGAESFAAESQAVACRVLGWMREPRKPLFVRDEIVRGWR